MIFVLIAGSYTPVCTIALKGVIGYGLLGLVWTIALLGIIFKLFWVTCPKWISSVMYIAMGWTCILAISPIIHSLSRFAFSWLALGGIIYTIGGIIYALKLPVLIIDIKTLDHMRSFTYLLWLAVPVTVL